MEHYLCVMILNRHTESNIEKMKIRKKGDKNMAKFCGKCGSKLDEGTGKCPNCEAEEIKKAHSNENKANIPSENNTDKVFLSKKEQKKQKKFDKKREKLQKREAKRLSMSKKKKAFRFFLKLLIFVMIISFFVAGIIAFFIKLNIIKKQDIKDILGIKESRTIETVKDEKITEEITSESYEVPTKNADEYYKNNSQIISEINIKDSDKVSSEKDIKRNFGERGFNNYPITYEYSMDGQYSDASEISDSSDEKHPMYTTYYVTENGDVWTIVEVNGTIVANPVFYNEQSELPVQLIISETESIVSYDSAKNKFYETIPNNLALLVKKVEKINNETLEKLTIEEIDSL